MMGQRERPRHAPCQSLLTAGRVLPPQASKAWRAAGCAELCAQPSPSSAWDSSLPFDYITTRKGRGGIDFVIVSSAKCFQAINCALGTLRSFLGLWKLLRKSVSCGERVQRRKRGGDAVLLERKLPLSRVTNRVWPFLPHLGNMFDKYKTGAGCLQTCFEGARPSAVIALQTVFSTARSHVHPKTQQVWPEWAAWARRPSACC